MSKSQFNMSIDHQESKAASLANLLPANYSLNAVAKSKGCPKMKFGWSDFNRTTFQYFVYCYQWTIPKNFRNGVYVIKYNYLNTLGTASYQMPAVGRSERILLADPFLSVINSGYDVEPDGVVSVTSQSASLPMNFMFPT